MPAPPSGLPLLLSTGFSSSLPLPPASPEMAAAAAAAAVGVRASAAALQLLLLLLAADLASRWSQQAAAASAAPSGVGRDYTLRSCSQTLSLDGLDWASVTWEPPVSQCSLTILPAAERRVLAWRRTVGEPTPASACFIDLYRWLCLPEQPHCNTLVVATARHEAGALLEPPTASDPAGLSLGRTDFVRLLYCGSGGTVLYLQFDNQDDLGDGKSSATAGSSNYTALLSVVLPTLLVALATGAVAILIGVCARRRRLKQRQIRRCQRSEPPPSYADCVAPTAGRPEQLKPAGSRRGAAAEQQQQQLEQSWQQQPPPPPYELAVATISLGRMPIVESSDFPTDRLGRCHDNPAFDDDLGESDSVRMAVGRGMRAQYSRNSRIISQRPGNCCRVTQV